MLCPDCHKNELKLFNGKYTKRCRFCSLKLHQGRANEKRIKEKEKLNKQKLITKICEGCNEKYETLIHNQKFCNNPCTNNKRSIAYSNDLWKMSKKPHKRQNFTF